MYHHMPIGYWPVFLGLLADGIGGSGSQQHISVAAFDDGVNQQCTSRTFAADNVSRNLQHPVCVRSKDSWKSVSFASQQTRTVPISRVSTILDLEILRIMCLHQNRSVLYS